MVCGRDVFFKSCRPDQVNKGLHHNYNISFKINRGNESWFYFLNTSGHITLSMLKKVFLVKFKGIFHAFGKGSVLEIQSL